MKRIVTILLIGFTLSCNTNKDQLQTKSPESIESGQSQSDKIKVLNFATFHMAATTDSKTVEFDEENKKNQEDALQIAKMVSDFEPTVICVEMPPSFNDELNKEYNKYLNNPDEIVSYYGEIGLVAFQVGKINNIKRIYGIDHQLDYNYNIGSELNNSLDSMTYNEFFSDPFKTIPDLNILEEGITLKERLLRMNNPKFLHFLITYNADILTYVGTENGFEGADEAAKYYHRNLRIYSNLNRLPLNKEDRVFILTGGSHTAFLNEFLERSLKYEIVNTLDYLK